MELIASGPFPLWLFEVLGWVPAIVFPTATGLQLLTILHRKSAQGVSIPAWTLFAIANVCLFAYTEKYSELESIIGSVGTALLNVCIVIAAFRYRKKSDGNGSVARSVTDHSQPTR